MAKGVKRKDKEKFLAGYEAWANGASQAMAAKIAGMSIPTFLKYAEYLLLGIPFPDTLFDK